jgi:hypothetical protein
MLVTDNNDDGCKVEHIAKRCRSNNDSDEPLERNYAMLISVISLICPDALFEGIYNYLQMIKDDEFVKYVFCYMFYYYIDIYISIYSIYIVKN